MFRVEVSVRPGVVLVEVVGGPSRVRVEVGGQGDGLGGVCQQRSHPLVRHLISVVWFSPLLVSLVWSPHYLSP